MAASEAMKLARMAAKEADKQRMFALLTNPAVVSAATLLGGLYLANQVRWDKDDARNADIRAIAMGGVAIGAMASSGVRDKYVLGGFGLAAGLSGLDPVSFPSSSDLTQNYGLGADAKLFGQAVPGITPGTSAWEWLLGPIMPLYEKLKGK